MDEWVKKMCQYVSHHEILFSFKENPDRCGNMDEHGRHYAN